MSKMVEKVARAICKAADLDEWERATEVLQDLYREEARAAIAAMLEPTEEMIGVVDFSIGIGEEDSDEDLADAWRLMIQEALR